jgi:superfamily II DNA/RNA helicase
VRRFQQDPACRAFITTNAGATGLNLQAADTVVNVDLPWNPAVLEQRIARAHRMGQKRPVQVYILVTEGTIEEKLLGTLAAKQDLALAAIDIESDVDALDVASGASELKSRLEVLLGRAPDAPIDESERRQNTADEVRFARRDEVSRAAGDLLSASFGFLDRLLPHESVDAAETSRLAEHIRRQLEDCMERDGDGCAKLTVTLSDDEATDRLSKSLARLLVTARSAPG